MDDRNFTSFSVINVYLQPVFVVSFRLCSHSYYFHISSYVVRYKNYLGPLSMVKMKDGKKCLFITLKSKGWIARKKSVS